MYRTVRLAKSKEEKVAEKITALLSDLSLDIEAIGFQMAKSAPYIIYCRAREVLEAMEYNKTEEELSRTGIYYNKR